MRHIQGMKTKLSSFQIIVFGFLGMILCGTILLMLPMASGAGVATPLPKALFTHKERRGQDRAKLGLR